MKRLLYIADEHYPYTIGAVHNYNSPTKATPFLNFLKDFDPHILIQGGDQLDLGIIGHWNQGNLRFKEGKRLLKEYEGYNVVLDQREKRMKHLETHIMLMGNHEQWIDDLLDENPQLEGMVEVQKNLRLAQRGIKWIGRRKHHRVGHAYFIHGDYKDGYLPINPGKAIAGIYGKSVFYGHQHKNHVYSAQTPFDQKPIQVTGIGCLCNLNPHWRRNQPSDWLNSFAVMQIEPNGNFHHTVINIVDGKFVYDGTLYR